MRKITLFIALILSASVWAFHDFKSGDCYYNIVSNTPPYTVKVAQGWQMYDGSWGIIPYSGDIVIPDSVVYNNICYSVVAIQDFIFNGCPALTSVKVGNNIHTIGKHAFSSNPRLKKVVLPETLTTIGDEAFIQCDSLHTINIPSSLTTTGKNLFDDCPSLDTVIWNVRENISFTHFQSHKNISHLIIGDSATIIPESAFSGCRNLTTIDFGSNLKTIGRSAFFNTGLRSVILPEGIDSVAALAFHTCNSLKVVSIPSSLQYVKGGSTSEASFGSSNIDSIYWNAHNCATNQPFYYTYNKRIRVVEFGDSIKHIPNSFCDRFDSLTTIIYPNHLQSIGKNAFFSCDNLSSVMILDSVSTIGESAFSGCSNLDTVNVHALTPPALGNKAFNSLPLCFIPCGTLEAYQNSVWKSQVGSIEEVCEWHDGTSCETAIPIHWQDSIMLPTNNEVWYQVNLNSAIAAGQDILWRVFNPQLSGRDSNPVTLSIEVYADCSSMNDTLYYAQTEIQPQSNISTLFDYTEHLLETQEYVYVRFKTSAFWNFDENLILSADFAKHTELEQNCDDIAIRRVGEFFDSEEITPTDDWYGLDFSLFEENAKGCFMIISNKSMDSVSVSIDGFLSCSAIEPTYSYIGDLSPEETIVMPFDYTPFDICYLHAVSTGDVVIQWVSNKCGEHLYWDYQNENKHLTITGYGEMDNFFLAGPWGYLNVTSVSLPDGITHIGNFAFFMSNLSHISFPSTVESIGLAAFGGCQSLQSVNIPQSVKMIDGTAFTGCGALQSIIVESANTMYDSRNDCNAIIHTESNSLVVGCINTIIPESIVKIGENAFANIAEPSLGTSIVHTSLKIPQNVISIGASAFVNTYFDTLYVEALTPPAIDSTTFNTFPICYVSCGTLEAYQNSDWATYMESIEEYNQAQYAEETVTACDSYTWNGKTYTASGDYIYTTTATNGCDSIVTLRLTINQTKYAEEHVTACDSYTWNGETYTASGDYTYTTVAANGCDSIVTLHLTINNSEIGETEYVTICYGETYTWNGQIYSTEGEYSTTLSNSLGCDSVATLQLTIMPEATTTTETVVIGNDELPYTWRGNTYLATGRYTDVEQYAHAACDSAIHVLDLTVLTTGNFDEQSVTICDSEAPYQWYGKSYTATGKYTYTEKYVGTDIDSIQHILNLTVNPTVYTEETMVACDSYEWNGQTYTQSGDYTYTTVAANGCDSIVTLHLTINQTQYAEEIVTACDSYTWNGEIYTESGEYTYTTTATNGCDSIVTLHLTINHIQYAEETVVACNSYTWNGETYTASGEYIYTTTAANGCDSIVTLHLTINRTQYAEETVTACDSYLWNGETYTASGEYIYTTTAANGCDSVVTLHLIINATKYAEETVIACDSYTWNGETYTESGEYTYTTTAANGCDSIVTLHLTINATQYAEETVTACDSYTWNGETYTASGDYTYNTTTDQGCERVEVLHLTILPDATTESEKLALCPSELPYEWYGQVLTEAGTYSATEQYAGMECDSVIHELTLDVYVQTLPATVTQPIVRTGEAIDVTIPTAEIQAHIAAETWYAPNAEVAWYIMENNDWAALTTDPVAAGTPQVVLKYAVETDCGNIESDNMVIDVIPTSVENINSQSPISNCQKVLYEDHIYILRDGKMYTIMGQDM